MHTLGGCWIVKHSPFRCTQRCSIRLISGDWAGQTSTWMSLSSNHCVAFLEVCLGSLSCWNILFSSGTSNFSKLSITPSSKILLCIHDPLYLCELPYPIPPHTPPDHKIIPSSMLDSGGWWSCLKVVPPSASKYKPSHLTQSC